jgi:hypothetical protein
MWQVNLKGGDVMESLRSMVLLIILACLSIACSLTAAEESTMPTVTNAQLEASAIATQAWLDKIDKGQYGESWDNGADLLKLTMTKDDWQKLLEKTRKPLGAVKSRQVSDQRVAKNPKGLPAGDYIVMVYKTTFAKKANATELVTLFLQEGEWRVLTYQIG